MTRTCVATPGCRLGGGHVGSCQPVAVLSGEEGARVRAASGRFAADGLPLRARKVLAALDAAHAPVTGLDIVAATGMSRRSVYGGLQTLREARLVKQQRSLKDARVIWFWVRRDVEVPA